MSEYSDLIIFIYDLMYKLIYFIQVKSGEYPFSTITRKSPLTRSGIIMVQIDLF